MVSLYNEKTPQMIRPFALLAQAFEMTHRRTKGGVTQ